MIGKTITLCGIMPNDDYTQMDVYSCGPIAINRFASLLKECHELSKLGVGLECKDGVLLAMIKTPDELKENNPHNAAKLFKHLLQNMGNAVSFCNDGEKEDKDSKKGSDGTIDNPINLDDTPIWLVIADSEDSKRQNGNAKGSEKDPSTDSSKDSKNDVKQTPPNRNKDKNDSKADPPAKEKKETMYQVKR